MIKDTFNTAILGAGAAGLWCAANMPKTDKIVIEHNNYPALKILASGGGNCNFTNKNVGWQNYYGSNPRFCASALAGFTPEDFLNVLRRKRIAFEERENGQYFAFGASTVLDTILSLCNKANTQLEYNTEIISVKKEDKHFKIECKHKTFYADNVVVALGAKSFPKLGATDKAYEIAQSFNLPVTPLYPALTGLIFDEKLKNKFSRLSGISCRAEVSCGKKKITSDILFTHEGLSGPAVLKLSLYGIKGKEVKVNFLPKTDIFEFFTKNKQSTKKLHNLLDELMPAKMAAVFADGFEKTLADAKKADMQKIADAINRFTFVPKDITGYERAEITAGGIDTKKISSKTMQVNEIEGLFFIGECLDVSGDLGGFNLHWAWASAFAAAGYIEQKNIT